jgi:hypothetical protein
MQVQRRFCGDIQLTFYRSFSYSHSKSLALSLSALQLATSRRRNIPQVSSLQGDDRPYLLFHTSNHGSSWSYSRIWCSGPVATATRSCHAISMAVVLCSAHPDDPVEMLRGRGLNTTEQDLGLILAASNRKRCHDVSYRYTTMVTYGVEIGPGSLRHEDLRLNID